MQVVEAVDSLHSEFRAVDNLVARNTTRVLKAFQNARIGSHVSKLLVYLDVMAKMVIGMYYTWMRNIVRCYC